MYLRRSTRDRPEVVGHQEQTVRIPVPRERPPKAAPRRELAPLGAVVFLPPGVASAGRWTDMCGDYVQRRGYRLAAVCTAWRDVISLLFTGEAQVVVVGRRDHLPRDRTPRVEFITDSAATADQHRRPQRRK